MFATLLGPLPRPPLAADATREAILGAVVAAQVEAGLEPLTDGGWPVEPDDPVASWRATAGRTDRAVKAVLAGPFTARVAHAGSVDPWRRSISALAEAGCPIVEIAEPDATRIGEDPGERARFRDLHERLLDGFVGVHLSLAITGGSADDAGAETVLTAPYASLAVDLIGGPDNWRLVTATPGDRGIVCGALAAEAGSDDGPELLMWAGAYAAASQGRGLARVGLATASTLAALPWDVARRKLDRLGEAARLAARPPAEQLAAMDPRAIDIRSAALGRYDPAAPRRRPR